MMNDGSIRVQGLQKALSNLKLAAATVKGTTYAGVLRAAYFIKGEAQLRTPVETGNLKSSAYVVGRKTKIEAEVGFTAAYAIWVHEIPATHVVGEDKFLEKAVDQNVGAIVGIIKGAIST